MLKIFLYIFKQVFKRGRVFYMFTWSLHSYLYFHLHQVKKTICLLLITKREMEERAVGGQLEPQILGSILSLTVWHWAWISSLVKQGQWSPASKIVVRLMWKFLKSKNHVNIKGASETCIPIGMIMWHCPLQKQWPSGFP